ncbi:MAG: hypothetical protein HXS53_05860 [Theionarchaea archaeon]|nr:hypothetical protein [Theionarchaea archaeon]
MKITIWRNREEKYKFFGLLVLVFTMPFSIFFFNRDTYKADIDGDGIDETIKDTNFLEGGSYRMIYDDGIIYQTLYDGIGEVMLKWKLIPSEDEDDPPTALVWDNEFKQWLPDQNQNGIPDYRE